MRDAPVHTGGRRAVIRTVLSIAAAAFCAVHGPAAAVAATADAGGGAAAQALHRLLDSEWDWELAQFPERATFLGDHRYDDRLTDGSPAAVAARREHHRERLAALRTIDRSALTGEDRLSWDILTFDFELAVRGDELLRFVAAGRDLPFSSDDSPLDINQMNGPQFNLRQLALATRFQDEQIGRASCRERVCVPV